MAKSTALTLALACLLGCFAATTVEARMGGGNIHIVNKCSVGSICVGACADASACHTGKYCYLGSGECTVSADTECFGHCYTGSGRRLMNSRRSLEGKSPSGEEMSAAIEAAKMAVEYMKGITDEVKQSAQKVQDDINKWGGKIEGVSDEKLQEYVTEVSGATILLKNAEVEADATMEGILSLTTVTVNTLQAAVGDDDKMKNAIKMGQLTFGAALSTAAKRLGELRTQIQSAQLSFNKAKDMSALFSRQITDQLNNKDGWLDSQKETIRAAAYGGCVASVLGGPAAVAICYGIAAPVVETNIASMQETLDAQKNTLNSFKGQFEDLTTKTTTLVTEATERYNEITKVQSNLQTTESLVAASDDIMFWNVVVLPQLGELQATVTNALKRN